MRRLCFAVVTIANGATVIFGEFNGVEIIRGGNFSAEIRSSTALL